MDKDALSSLTKDKRILAIILVVVIAVAAVAAWSLTRDNGGSDAPSDDVTIGDEQTFTEDMDIEGTLTILEKGKLKLGDGVELRMIGPNAKIDVKGEFDASAGTIAFYAEDKDGNLVEVYENGKDETRSITSTGTMTVDGENFKSTSFTGDVAGIFDFVDGVFYVSDKNVVISSLAKAVGAVPKDKDMDIYINGSLNDAADLTIPAHGRVLVADGSDVTLGKITLNGGGLGVSGKLDAKVTAGKGVYEIKDGSGLTFTNSGDKVIAYGILKGELKVNSGEAYVDTLTVTDSTAKLTVEEGGVLRLVKVGNSDGKVITSTPKANEPAQVVINGVLAVGVQPVTEGTTPIKVINSESGVQGTFTIGEKGYCKYYAGSKVPTADKKTTFTIDSTPYMIAFGNATMKSVLDGEIPAITGVTGEAFKNIANWNNKPNMSGDAVAETTAIGVTGYGDVYYATVKVDIKLNIDSNVVLKIDGNLVQGNKVTLAAGDHTITVNPPSGKTCTITFDGSTIQDGGVLKITSGSKDKELKVIINATSGSEPETSGS